MSVIVLGWRDAPCLLRCLAALRRHCNGTIPYEVLLFLNEPSPALVARAGQVHGASVFESPINLGFAGANNAAAASARGELIVLLNDDAEVEPEWLETLVNTADAHPTAGVIGSCSVNASGVIQEAGGQVWRDGSVSLHGKGEPADRAEFTATRPVEFVSGCSLLIRRGLWNTLGGFDERFYPAYYEDVDLCLRVQRAGFGVLCAGESRVRHTGSASLPHRLRDFIIARNAAVLRELWASELVERSLPPAGVNLPWPGAADLLGTQPAADLDRSGALPPMVRTLQRESALYSAYARAVEHAGQQREQELVAQIEGLRGWATDLERRFAEREDETARTHGELQRWALELQDRVRALEAEASLRPTGVVRVLSASLRAAGTRLRRSRRI